MSPYLFFLGHNTDLSLAELASRFPGTSFTLISPHLATASFKTPPTPVASQLGTLTKLATFLTSVSPDSLVDSITDYLKQNDLHLFSLSLTQEAGVTAASLSQQIKNTLSQDKFASRFILAKGDSVSPLIIASKKLTEFIYHPAESQLFVTTWTHDYNAWISRDRSRPYITPKLGMLPPKLARSMVNLALYNRDPKETTLLDPFCGSGTLLMEARLLGLSVLGSDISIDQVTGAQKNLAWLPQEQFLATPKTFSVIKADATHLSTQLTSPVDVIVTEPYLGPLHPQPEKYADISKGLYKLYLGAIKDWQKFLTHHNTIVLAYPVYPSATSEKYLARFVDYCENLGYNLRVKNLVFTRPGAKIERHIIILDK